MRKRDVEIDGTTTLPLPPDKSDIGLQWPKSTVAQTCEGNHIHFR